MKILKEGILPSSRIYRAVCNYCKTEVEFTREEAVHSGHRNDAFVSVSCPLCTKTIHKDADCYE